MSYDDNVSNKRRRLSPPILLLKYPFLMPLILKYLNDEDVLMRLLLTGKPMKLCLTGYLAKASVVPFLAKIITGWNLYLPVKVDEIFDWRGEDLRFYGDLKVVDAAEDFDDPIGLAEFLISLTSITLSDEFETHHSWYVSSIHEGNRVWRQFRLYNSTWCIAFNVQYLQLGSCYNQQLLPGAIPQSVTQVLFGKDELYGSFDQPLSPRVLPDSLTVICMGAAFNQPLLPNHLPAALSRLTFGDNFSQPLTET